MQTVTLLAQKGGTGKTSIALALAVCAADAGQIAVILDVDPQATACNWHHRRRHADAPVVSRVQPTRLRHTCATAAAQGVDLAVIDTPARTEAAALEAARVADLVIIPCRPQIYDVETIPATQQLLARAGHPSAVVILNAVPSRGQRRVEQVRTAVARFGLPVCPFTVGHRAAVGDAAALGLTVTEFQPSSPAADEARQVARWIGRVLAQPDMLKGSHTPCQQLTLPLPFKRLGTTPCRPRCPCRRCAPRRRPITVHCNPEVREQLKRLALDQHTTMRRLICQALNELFASHQLPEIAQ